jgi:hypothetical protein
MGYQKLYLMNAAFNAKYRKLEIKDIERTIYEVLITDDNLVRKKILLFKKRNTSIVLLEDKMNKIEFKKIIDAIYAREERDLRR